MKIVDVCDNCSGAGCLKQHYDKNNISDYQIICINSNLTIGDIKNDHLSFIRELYKDNSYDYTDSIDCLLNNINNDTKIRVWSSKGSSSDYLLLLYVCNLLKDICDNISAVFTTDYNKYVLSINALDYSEIESILKYEKQLTKEEINNYSNEWEKLVEINSELRVMENGYINNKSFSDYDTIILNRLKELGKCKLSNLIANLMINFLIDDVGDIVYLYLIDRLISQDKIKIVDKGEQHFTDIIEIASE